MGPIGPMGFRRGGEKVRRQVDMAAAAAWEALVEAHTHDALRFVGLMAQRMGFDQALDRYLDELDVRDPMASAVRSRVLISLEQATDQPEPLPPRQPRDDAGPEQRQEEGLRRFRPDVLVKDIARKVRTTGETDDWVRLAVARAEEGIILVHVENAVAFTKVLQGQAAMHDAVDDYLELMRVSGGRAQSVHQRAMARLAEIHLPAAGEEGWEEPRLHEDE